MRTWSRGMRDAMMPSADETGLVADLVPARHVDDAVIATQEVEADPLGFLPRARPTFRLPPTGGARGRMGAVTRDHQHRTAG
jgi:hypothetical protein